MFTRLSVVTIGTDSSPRPSFMSAPYPLKGVLNSYMSEPRTSHLIPHTSFAFFVRSEAPSCPLRLKKMFLWHIDFISP